jgi:hypothetical protein
MFSAVRVHSWKQVKCYDGSVKNFDKMITKQTTFLMFLVQEVAGFFVFSHQGIIRRSLSKSYFASLSNGFHHCRFCSILNLLSNPFEFSCDLLNDPTSSPDIIASNIRGNKE